MNIRFLATTAAAFTLFGAVPSLAVNAVVDSIFDPDDVPLAAPEEHYTLGSNASFNTDTLEFHVGGSLVGVGSLGYTEGKSSLGSQEVALFSFNNLTITGSIALLFSGSRPVYFLSRGSLTVDSTIGGFANYGVPGGFAGGTGDNVFSGTGTGSTPGSGPGGGGTGANSLGRFMGGGGGFGTPGSPATEPGGGAGGSTYGDAMLRDITGGSGGGGGDLGNPFGSTGFISGVGSRGGGALGLIAQDNITFSSSAQIVVSSYDDYDPQQYAGGGGSGGALLIASPSVYIENGAEFFGRGDTGASGSGSLQPGRGGEGGKGRIALYHNGDLTGLAFAEDDFTNEFGTFYNNNGLDFPVAVPEPSALVFAGLLPLALLRRRRM